MIRDKVKKSNPKLALEYKKYEEMRERLRLMQKPHSGKKLALERQKYKKMRERLKPHNWAKVAAERQRNRARRWMIGGGKPPKVR